MCVHTAGSDILLDILSRLELPANFPANDVPFVMSNGRRGDPMRKYRQCQADDEKARKCGYLFSHIYVFVMNVLLT